MTSNLQDYSIATLTAGFTEMFSTENFSQIIEEWVLSTSKNIGLMAVALARESKARSTKNSTQFMTSFLADNIYFLEGQLRDEREKRVSSHRGFSKADLDFLTLQSNGYLIHETLCIFDWIHNFSFDKFLFENDNVIIHLLFSVCQRETYCDCELISDYEFDRFSVWERKLINRLETPRNFDGPESHFQKWTRLLSLLNNPTTQQRWDELRRD